MSSFLDAFEDALDGQEDETGERKKARVGSVENDALVGAATFDEILVRGGRAESGGLTIQMRAADFQGVAPAKGTPATADGLTLEVLRCDNRNGVFVIVLGEFAAQEEN